MDAARTGVVDGAPPEDMEIRWTRELGESVDSSPAVVGDRVYVGADNGRLYCLAEADGAPIWEAQTDGCIVSSPAVADGIAYVGSVDRCLYAFSAADGEFLWRVKTKEPVLAPPLAFAGRVYFGSMDGGFRCVDATTGKPHWKLDVGAVSGAAAAGTEGVVYFGDHAGAVYAVDAATGTVVWQTQLKGKIVASPLLLGDRLVVGVMGPTALTIQKIKFLVALDIADGKELWSQFDGASVLSTPVADESAVYFGMVSGYTSSTELRAVNLQTGKEMWKRKLGGVADSSALLIGDRIMFGLHDGQFHIASTTNGNDISTVDIGAKLYSSPGYVDGRVYIGAGDGKLYCME